MMTVKLQHVAYCCVFHCAASEIEGTLSPGAIGGISTAGGVIILTPVAVIVIIVIIFLSWKKKQGKWAAVLT